MLALIEPPGRPPFRPSMSAAGSRSEIGSNASMGRDRSEDGANMAAIIGHVGLRSVNYVGMGPSLRPAMSSAQNSFSYRRAGS
jgi:hypothetical protein